MDWEDWDNPDPAAVVTLTSDRAWSRLARRYEPNSVRRPFGRCLEVARANGAVAAVIEARYIDVDYRSEFSGFFSRKFAAIPDSTHRLHFFANPVPSGRLWNLPEAVVAAYLGYVVIRPSEMGRVGRSMLTPPPDVAGWVHCSVDERVHLFGQTLVVRGVPFAQQDTELGRCAHVAAWICHRTAVLRGEVAPRPMADFSLRADHRAAEGRPLPSEGLTALELSGLLGDFGLPAVVYRMGAIAGSGQEPPVPKHAADDDPGRWDTRVIAVLCRYLNGGYPVVVGTHDHAFTIIGHRRRGRRWTDFVRHDDQRGPYLPVGDILEDVDPATGHRQTWQLLLVPVPDKLWLRPEPAERMGRALMLAYDKFEGGERLSRLDAGQELAYRTYATASQRYKESAAARRLGQTAVRELRMARLSRLVWVVEAVHRERREAGRPSVLGEVLFDSTSSDLAPGTLAIRVPDALLIRRTNGTLRSPLRATSRAVCSATPVQP